MAVAVGGAAGTLLIVLFVLIWAIDSLRAAVYTIAFALLAALVVVGFITLWLMIAGAL